MAGTPPLKNSAYTFEMALDSQDDANVFQTSVTLAVGDVTVVKDGGTPANITNLPVEIGTTGILVVSLTADEMNADRVTVRFHDVADAEWKDCHIYIETSAKQIGDLVTDADLAVVDGVVDAIKAKTDLIPASIPTAAQTADAVWDELLSGHTASGSAGASLSTAAAGSAGAGAGANEVPITVNDGVTPLDGVEVWVTSDAAGSNTIASGISDAFGVVTVYLDAGTYYVWKQLAGYNFTNPETMVV